MEWTAARRHKATNDDGRVVDSSLQMTFELIGYCRMVPVVNHVTLQRLMKTSAIERPSLESDRYRLNAELVLDTNSTHKSQLQSPGGGAAVQSRFYAYRNCSLANCCAPS